MGIKVTYRVWGFGKPAAVRSSIPGVKHSIAHDKRQSESSKLLKGIGVRIP